MRQRFELSKHRVARGGDFRSPASHARAAARGRLAIDVRQDCVGVRPARSLGR